MQRLLLLLLLGCSGVSQELDPGKIYRRDIEINVNGHQGDGVLVVPRSAKYEIKIKSPGKMDLYTLTTCHREEVGQKDGFWSNKKLVYDYLPAPGLEDNGACPMHLGAYEKTKGRHAWGLVDFEDPQTTLPARVRCNGSLYNSNGVTICQAKEGLVQEIEFANPVVAEFDAKCPEAMKNNKILRYTIKKGHCVHYFQEINDPGRVHRLTTIGYESILIREF